LKIIVCIVFIIGIFGAGCTRTEETIKIKGIVSDEYTKHPISKRNIIVHGIVGTGKNSIPIEAGYFFTDSAGCFSYSLKKIKNARTYSFSVVGDTVYSFKTEDFDPVYLENHSKQLTFSLHRLTSLTIFIARNLNTHVRDTLYLGWRSDGEDGRTIYPYKIRNYVLSSSAGLKWIGGDVNAVVKTMTFANHKTTLKWELFRKGRRNEIIDTITCRRDFGNKVYFRY
jgi:hypothetical protein